MILSQVNPKELTRTSNGLAPEKAKKPRTRPRQATQLRPWPYFLFALGSGKYNQFLLARESWAAQVLPM
jgi:hypothetical protein